MEEDWPLRLAHDRCVTGPTTHLARRNELAYLVSNSPEVHRKPRLARHELGPSHSSKPDLITNRVTEGSAGKEMV
jgi:hypothetical protein